MYFLGDVIPTELVEKLQSTLFKNVRISNSYGSGETTIDYTYNFVDINDSTINLPIGHLFPNYRCVILDEFLQSVIINQEGELFVAGVGPFAAYLGRNDLTAEILTKVNDEIFCRSGDLVRMDDKGLLHYIGRKDRQMKLDGQSMEINEIERCLLGHTSISACVVIKWNDDHLVAYVQSSDVDEEQLREYCQSHLSSHMIPSVFIILKQLPINENGKIEQNLLPAPHPSALTNGDHTDSIPLTALEEQLRSIFSKVFDKESIDIDRTFGQMGGSSLDALRTLYFIRQQICIDINSQLLYDNPSVRQLAQAIQSSLLSDDNLSATSESSPLVEELPE
jgi:acyl carrier protein